MSTTDRKWGRLELYRADSISVLHWRGSIIDVRLSHAHAPEQPTVVALSMHRKTPKQRAAEAKR